MSRTPGAVRRAAHAAFIAAFVALISCPLLARLTGLAPPTRLEENRRLAPPPVLALDGRLLTTFPAAFDAYFNDHFAFRDRLVYAYHRALVQGFAVSPRPDLVAIGSGGWLYFVPQAMDEYRADCPFTPEELACWAAGLEEKRAWCAARGIRYLFLVAPDSQTINPEHLPAWVGRPAGPSRLDQLLAYVRAHSEVTVLDPRAALLEAKKRERVYARTDTHWNARGALVASRCVAEALRGRYPAVRPLRRSDFRERSVDAPGGDLALLLGFREVLREERPELDPAGPRRARPAPDVPLPCAGPDTPAVFRTAQATECDDPGLPTGFVYHDSFGDEMRPFLSEYFRRVVYQGWRGLPLDRELVSREKPDVVIEEIVERTLAASAYARPAGAH